MFLKESVNQEVIILEKEQLKSLLNALSNKSEALTESEIQDVLSIQDIIKEGNTISLSEEARLEYQEFMDKIQFFDDSLNEGIIGSMGADIKSGFQGTGTEIKGWFEDINEKLAHINKNSDELISWLNEESNDVPLHTDSSLKKFFKTSSIQWRFFFILNDSIYNRILKTVKSDEKNRFRRLF